MVGRDLSALYQRSAHTRGRTVLSVENVSSADVHDISFEVHAGEVVVLAGLVGAGRTELARAIIGDVPLTSGKIRVDGRALQLRSPRDAVRAGLCLAPEERKAQALLMKRSVRDNISLAVLQRLSRWHVVNRREERQLAERYLRELHIRTPSIEQEVATLSGGNQQKTVLARWLARESKLLILDEPTRGVDVGAKADIYAIIDRLASQRRRRVGDLVRVAGGARARRPHRCDERRHGFRHDRPRRRHRREDSQPRDSGEGGMSPSFPEATAPTPPLPPRRALRRVLDAIGVQNVSLLIALGAACRLYRQPEQQLLLFQQSRDDWHDRGDRRHTLGRADRGDAARRP